MADFNLNVGTSVDIDQARQQLERLIQLHDDLTSEIQANTIASQANRDALRQTVQENARVLGQLQAMSASLRAQQASLQAGTREWRNLQTQINVVDRAVLQAGRSMTAAQRSLDTSARSSVSSLNALGRAATQTTGILEGLRAKSKALQTALSQATNIDDIRQINGELSRVRSNIATIEQQGRQAANGGLAGMSRELQTILSTAGIAFGTAGVLDFGKRIVQVSGQLQQFDTTLMTMLQNRGQVDKLTADVIKLVKQSPFEFEDAQKYVTQLLAMGIETQKLIPTFTALGNIASAVGKEKLPQLTLALGQVNAKTRLTGEELKQFTEAGVNLIPELAKVTGFTEKAIASDTAKMGISYKQVEQAIFNLGLENGKFAGLMTKQAQTTTGLISTIADNFYFFVGKIGQSTAGPLNSLLQWIATFTGELTETDTAFNKFVRNAGAAITAFIAYKTVISSFVLNLKAVRIAQAEAAVSTAAGTVQTEAATVAQIANSGATLTAANAWKALGLAIRTNPIGFLVGILSAVASAVLLFQNATESATESMTDEELKIRSLQARFKSLTTEYTSNSAQTVGATTRRKIALQQLIAEYPEYFKGLEKEANLQDYVNKIIKIGNDAFEARIRKAQAAYEVTRLTEKQNKAFRDQSAALDELKVRYKNTYANSKGDVNAFIKELDRIGVVTDKQVEKFQDADSFGAKFKKFLGAGDSVNLAILKQTRDGIISIQDDIDKASQKGLEASKAALSGEVEIENKRHAKYLTNKKRTNAEKQEEEIRHNKRMAELQNTDYTQKTPKPPKEGKSPRLKEYERDNAELAASKELAGLKELAATRERDKREAELESILAEGKIKREKLTAEGREVKLKQLRANTAEKLLAIDKKYNEDDKKEFDKIANRLSKQKGKLNEEEIALIREQGKSKIALTAKTEQELEQLLGTYRVSRLAEEDKERADRIAIKVAERAALQSVGAKRKEDEANIDIEITAIRHEGVKARVDAEREANRELLSALKEKLAAEERLGIEVGRAEYTKRARNLAEYEQLSKEYDEKLRARKLTELKNTIDFEDQKLKVMRAFGLEGTDDYKAVLANQLRLVTDFNNKKTEGNSRQRLIELKQLEIVAQKQREVIGSIAGLFASSSNAIVSSLGRGLQEYQNYAARIESINAALAAKEISQQQATLEKKLAIAASGVTIAQTLATGFFNFQQQQAEMQLQRLEANHKREEASLQASLDTKKTALETAAANEIALLQADFDAKRITEEDFNAKKKLREETLKNDLKVLDETFVADKKTRDAAYEAEKLALQKKAIQAKFKADIATAVAGAALAVIQAFQLGPIAGAIAAVVVGAATIAQIGIMKKQRDIAIESLNFAKGTEYVDREGRYPSGVDTVPANLTKGERVVPVAENKQLQGYSNKEMVAIFNEGLAVRKRHEQAREEWLNMAPMLNYRFISPESHPPIVNVGGMDTKKLEKEIKGLRKDISGIWHEQHIIQHDERGVTRRTVRMNRERAQLMRDRGY